jgi:predicted nucleic-acid-binding Zn-ribbon protein
MRTLLQNISINNWPGIICLYTEVYTNISSRKLHRTEIGLTFYGHIKMQYVARNFEYLSNCLLYLQNVQYILYISMFCKNCMYSFRIIVRISFGQNVLRSSFFTLKLGTTLCKIIVYIIPSFVHLVNLKKYQRHSSTHVPPLVRLCCVSISVSWGEYTRVQSLVLPCLIKDPPTGRHSTHYSIAQ